MGEECFCECFVALLAIQKAFENNGRQKGLTEQEHFGWTCDLLGIIPELAFESGGQLLRRIILFLAGLEPIVI